MFFEVFNIGGQTVVLVLMQLGGIGIISLTTLAGLLISKPRRLFGENRARTGAYHTIRAIA